MPSKKALWTNLCLGRLRISSPLALSTLFLFCPITCGVMHGMIHLVDTPSGQEDDAFSTHYLRPRLGTVAGPERVTEFL